MINMTGWIATVLVMFIMGVALIVWVVPYVLLIVIPAIIIYYVIKEVRKDKYYMSDEEISNAQFLAEESRK